MKDKIENKLGDVKETIENTLGDVRESIENKLEDAQNLLENLGLESQEQEGITYVDRQRIIPGRVPLLPVTMLMMLFSVSAFLAVMWHFIRHENQYIFPMAIAQAMYFSQIALYHSSFRTLRTALGVIHWFFTAVLTALIVAALIDKILYPVSVVGVAIYTALLFYLSIFLTMTLHCFYFGRGSRIVE